MLEEKCDAKCTLPHRNILLYYIKIKIKIITLIMRRGSIINFWTKI